LAGETAFHADETLAMMRYTTMLEEKLMRSATYWDWFKGTDLRHRTTGASRLFLHLIKTKNKKYQILCRVCTTATPSPQ
jgi:hypothetical protein